MLLWRSALVARAAWAVPMQAAILSAADPEMHVFHVRQPELKSFHVTSAVAGSSETLYADSEGSMQPDSCALQALCSSVNMSCFSSQLD